MSRPVLFALAALAAAALGAAAWLFLKPEAGDRFAACRESIVVAGGGDIGGPFSLIDHTGRRVTEAEVIDRPAIVYFGYTYCPDICPADTAVIAEAVEILEEQGREVRPVFITIDPERDDVEAVAGFVVNLHPRMVGLTGSPAEIKAVAGEYRVYYAKADEDEEDYLMDHSTFAYLMAPEVGFLDIFRRDTGPEEMARRTACYLDRL